MVDTILIFVFRFSFYLSACIMLQSLHCHITCLGAPLFPGTVLDDTWLARCEDLKRAVDRLSLLSAQGPGRLVTAAGFFQCPQGSASLAVLAVSRQSRP